MKKQMILAVMALAGAAAFAQTEYAAKEFYRHGSGETPFVRLVGIEPGEYILAIDRMAASNGDEPRRIGCFLNGSRLHVTRSCPPNERTNEPGGEWIEFEKAAFKDGDILSFREKGDVPFKLKLLKKPLPHDVFRLFDEQTSSEIWIADLSGSTLTPTSLTVRVAGRLGRTIDECALDVRAYDFWQNDLVKETFKPMVDGDWEKTWTFPASASGETRAIIRYSLPDGQYVRRFLNARGDVRTGLRRRMTLGDFARTDAQKDAKTVSSVLTKTVTVPDWLREGRTLLHAERIYRTGKAFVNGREVGVQTRANQALPCEYDITDALAADGKAEIRFEVEIQKGEAPLTDVEIRCAPATRLVLRPVITTKLEGRTLKVETPSVPAGCAVSHRVLRRGKEVLKPFRDGETISWPDVELWGPTSFPLYELESSLVKDSKTIDRLSTRFGFREFSARGMDYLWNGKPYRGISRTAGMSIARYGQWDASRASLQRMLDNLETATHDDARFFRHGGFVETFYDWCDEIGYLAGFCSPLSKAGQMSTALDGDDALWADTLAVNGRMVDMYRHHPAINVWQLCGEFWVHSDDRAYNKMLPSFKLVHSKDPSRDTVCGADMDFRGMNKHIDTHYPAAQQFKQEDAFFPNSILWRPIDQPFTAGCKVPFGPLKRIGCCGLTSPLTWGVKPITCQETGWSVNIKRPHGSTQLFRDTSYGGFNTMEGHHSKLNSLVFLGQRDAGVTLIGAWRSAGIDNQFRTAPWLDVWVIERYHAFYEGTKVSYQVDLFHDLLKSETMDFFWRLERAGDGGVVAEKRESCAFDFCEYRRTKIAFTAPAAGRYRLVYGLGPKVKSLSVEVYAKRGDEGTLLKGEDIVGADDPIDDRLVERIRNGARVLLLPRKDYPAVFPVPLKTGGHNVSVNWMFRPDHPVLKGLTERDLSFWYPNHATGYEYFDKPVSGAAKTLIEAGGSNGLVYPGLLEIPMGKGTVYATRLDFDPMVNPIAAKLLRNIRGALGGHAAPQAVRKLGVVGEKYFKILKGWGVACELLTPEAAAQASPKTFAALLVDGKDKTVASTLNSQPETRNPQLALFVQDPDPKLWNVTRKPNAYSARQGAALRLVEDHPLLAGLTNYDFFWRKVGIGFAGENPGATNDPELMADPVGSDEIFGADDELLFPRFLAQRGNVYFSTLNMQATSRLAAPLCERVWTTMLVNLGVQVTPGVRVERPKYLKESPLDLPKDAVLASRYTEGPREIVLDPKGASCGWFVLRHAAKWTVEQLPAFRVVVTYADDSQSVTEFAGGLNVRDLDDAEDTPFALERATATRVAGPKGETPFGAGFAYETVWPNENPGKKIKSVRILSENHGATAVLGFALAEASKTPVADVKGDKTLCDRLAAEGSKLQTAKKYREAIAKYEEAHAADPRQLYVMNALGNCWQKLNDQKAAEKWYLKSLKTDINQPPVWGWLKSTGSTATLDDSGMQRGATSAPTLIVAGMTFSTDGGRTWTEDPPILSGAARQFKVKVEWAGGDSRKTGAQLLNILESADGREKHNHVDFKRDYFHAYRHLHQTPRPYVFDFDFTDRAPGTYKYRFRIWYLLDAPDPTLPGPDRRRVEATRSFSVLVK